ncbi:regulator [archaeon]|nr:MAG: regulator [archaeon]RLG64196.1 MAG: regulator [archaeon]
MSEVPLKPISREDIHKLESALLVGTLFRIEALEEVLKNPEKRLTWVDSLAVAAAALAREKAGMPISRIADEIGRTEATIRNHLAGKTKAGQLVLQTYQRFLKEGVKIEVADIEELHKRVDELENKVKELENKLSTVKSKLEETLAILE